MPKRRSLHLSCHDCSFPLTGDERDHYVYQCHSCAMDEHELLLRLKSDADNPDLNRLFSGPVDLGLRLA
jgi:hypothetical protein